MKGGSCKQEFICWEKCVDAAKANEEDFVAKCVEETTALRECMMKDPGYYGEMDDEGGGNDDDDEMMMRKVSVVRIIKVGVRVVEKIGVARKSRRGERTTTTRTMKK